MKSVKLDFELLETNYKEYKKVDIAAVLTKFHVPACQFMPMPNHREETMIANSYRIGAAPFDQTDQTLLEINRYLFNFMHQAGWKCIPAYWQPVFDRLIQLCHNWNLARKQEITDAHMELFDLNQMTEAWKKKKFKKNDFAKEEKYPELKPRRGIDPDSDWVKSFVFMCWRLIELIIYGTNAMKCPKKCASYCINCDLVELYMKNTTTGGDENFVKHVPVNARFRHIMEVLDSTVEDIDIDELKLPFNDELLRDFDRFNRPVDMSNYTKFPVSFDTDRRFIASDWSSMEGQCTEKVKLNVELSLFIWMTQCIEDLTLRKLVIEIATTNLHVITRHCEIKMSTCRNSGELATSIGNGILNHVVTSYILRKFGCKNVVGVKEGDDGLFSYYGPEVTEKQAAEIGFNLKLIHVDDMFSAGFCQMFGTTSGNQFCDPNKFMAKFGFVSRTYSTSKDSKHLSLLKAKALSFANMYPHQPIVRQLCNYILRKTKRHTISQKMINRMDLWDKLKYVEAKEFNIPDFVLDVEMMNRVEQLFGVTIAEQFALMKYFDEKDDFEIVPLGLLPCSMPDEWIANYYKNVVPVNTKQQCWNIVGVRPDTIEELNQYPHMQFDENLQPTIHGAVANLVVN